MPGTASSALASTGAALAGGVPVDASPFLLFLLFFSIGLCLFIWKVVVESRRLAFIRKAPFPPGLEDKFFARRPEPRRPEPRRDDAERVEQGLRQFFRAYLAGGQRNVAMPSKVVDDLWHEFILYTREYDAFCQKAFGAFLHHTSAAALTFVKKEPLWRRIFLPKPPKSAAHISNAGLRRVWWFSCKDENIDPRRPSELPLLFALDGELNIEGGYRYRLDRDGDKFSSTDFDGRTDGFGDRDSGDGGDGGDGGCGGGGD